MKLSLKAKLIAAFLLLIVIPMSVLGLLSYRMSSTALQKTIEEQLRYQTSQVAESIVTTTDSVKRNLKIASGNMDLASVAEGKDSKVFPDAFDYIRKLQQDNSDIIETVFITDSSGKAVMTNDEFNSSIDLSDREYVKKALEGTYAISEVLFSKATNKPVVAVAQPLIKGGYLTGVLIATIKFECISIHSAEIKVGEGGYSYIIDKTGLFIYHPIEGKVLKENLSSTATGELKNIVEQMKSGKPGEGFYTYEGIYKFVRYAPAANWVVAITANYDEYMAPAREIMKNTIFIAIGAALLAMIIAYVISTYGIVNPVRKLEKLMGMAGQGDLTVKAEVNTKDEIQALAESFNQMILHQSKIVKEVRMGAQELAAASEEMAASSEQVSSAAQQISSSILEVSKNAENQSSSVVEASKVLVQLSSLVQLAQNKALSASESSKHTMDSAQRGRAKVKDTVLAMDVISKSTEETAEVLKVLNELSSKVGGIVTTINSLAEQTNLLALNAAIEAARAGEHGRGFAVVADEVRKLSEQSNTGAGEIAGLVNEMIRQTERAVKSMDSSKSAVKNGVKVAGDTDNSFVDILGAVLGITKGVEEIADITKDEVATSDQIVKLIDTIATATETTSANSQEVSAATEEQTATVENVASTAEETSSMASALEELVRKFKVGDDLL